jgi:hypothetical protein
VLKLSLHTKMLFQLSSHCSEHAQNMHIFRNNFTKVRHSRYLLQYRSSFLQRFHRLKPNPVRCFSKRRYMSCL